MAATASNTSLHQPPTDGVTALEYSRNDAKLLLVSSWDTGVRLFDTSLNSLRHYYTHKAAVLDATFGEDDNHVVSGGLAQSVWMYDLSASAHTELGTHDKPVKCVEYSHAHRTVISGSWDKTVRCWDPRSQAGTEVAKFEVPERVYTMALSDTTNRLVVGTAERHVLVFDVRSIGKGPEQVRKSPLKFQTRCIRTFVDGQGFAISSIDGRVAMEYFDMSEEVQKKKYAFRCHREKKDGLEHVYPVNALAFNPVHGTFATGGCDGCVSTWDGVNRKRLANIPGFPTSIAALAFNKDGTELAIAASYTYEKGEPEEPVPDTVTIRTVAAKEVLPKAKKSKAAKK